MRRLCIPVVLLAAIGCQMEQVAERAEAHVQEDVESIEALFAHNASVINSGDLEGWVSQFTEDAVFMPPNSAPLHGRDAAREFARSWYEQLDMEFALTVDEIEVHGDWAFARWHYVGHYTPKVGGETIEDRSKEIWILRRQPDDTWKCSHIIYNTSLP